MTFFFIASVPRSTAHDYTLYRYKFIKLKTVKIGKVIDSKYKNNNNAYASTPLAKLRANYYY